MSDLLNSASLVMIPSGYKEDIVYSQIPTDGSGDLSFTRASNGTRVNSAGLVEVCPWNLVQQSETFDNAGWTQSTGGTSTVTVTANYGTAPNGTNTADRIQLTRDSSGFAQVVQSITTTASQSYTFSVYLKSLSGTPTVMFGSYGGTNAQTATLTNEWVRYTWTATSPSTSAFGMLMIWGGIASTSLSADFLAWGYQLNIGSTAKPYFPTTDRLNVPRLTYQNGGGGCPSLLLEKQSTNLVTYSEQFDNAAWIKNNTTITANAITSPDGTQNADKMADSINTASAFYIYQSPATTSTQYTSSGYFKKGEYNFVTLHAFGLNGAVFNLNTGVLVSQSGGTGTITSVGDGWYRCTFTFTAGGSAVFFSQSPAGNISYTGTIGSGIYAWGLQCEASSYPTSYIPTTSSSATRVDDAIGDQTSTIAQAFTDNTKGTIFFDIAGIETPSTGSEARFRFGNSTTALQIAFVVESAGLRIYSYNGGFSLTESNKLNRKIAIRFNGTEIVAFVNGVKQTTYTAPVSFNIEQMISNLSAPATFKINQFILFPTPLTDAECQALTA